MSSPPSNNRPVSAAPGKLTKFLRQDRRDVTRSPPVDREATAVASGAPESPVPVPIPASPEIKSTKGISIKSGKLFGGRRDRSNSVAGVSADTVDDDPVVSFQAVPQRRPRKPASDPSSSLSPSSTSSGVRTFSELPARLSGLWHTLSGSTSDLQSVLAQHTLASPQPMTGSPKSKQLSPLLVAARHGKSHLDKAMRYLLDSDAQPDKCQDPIWLMGVQHSGIEPLSVVAPVPIPLKRNSHRRDSTDTRSPSSFKPNYATAHTNSSSQSISSNAGGSVVSSSSKYAASWPSAFYTDFNSRIWCTYRNNFVPIRDTSLEALEPISIQSSIASISDVSSSPSKPKWNWGLGEKGWSSDSGWGCMLRTGQSLLANALIHLHLSREWRRPTQPTMTPEYATYVRILTWFLDNPSPMCPFAVHRVALAGKELGKDVGSWFGPSTAAGAIRRLVHEFPSAGLGVSVANDGVLYQADVYLASHVGAIALGPGSVPKASANSSKKTAWGQKAVLVLIGIRLGIDGVNPIYFESLKTLFTFPQCVGIAGGRPSSSYYFVGSQADNLFYLDPHHSRPTIPLRVPPPMTPDELNDDEENQRPPRMRSESPPPIEPKYRTSPISNRSTSLSSSYRQSPIHSRLRPSVSLSYSPPQSYHDTSSHDTSLDSISQFYVTSYTAAELKTFHCDRVRKMPLTGLDPSMLLGFLCRDEAEWLDFRERVSKLPKPIFAVQDERPSWSDDDDDLDIESASEPEVESSVIEDTIDTFLDSPEVPKEEPMDIIKETNTDESDSEDSDAPVAGHIRRDTLRPGAGGRAPSLPQGRTSMERIGMAESSEEEEEWIDTLAAAHPVAASPQSTSQSTSSGSAFMQVPSPRTSNPTLETPTEYVVVATGRPSSTRVSRSQSSSRTSSQVEVPFPTAAAVSLPSSHDSDPLDDPLTPTSSESGGTWSSGGGQPQLVPPAHRRERKTTVRKLTSGTSTARTQDRHSQILLSSVTPLAPPQETSTKRKTKSTNRTLAETT